MGTTVVLMVISAAVGWLVALAVWASVETE